MQAETTNGSTTTASRTSLGTGHSLGRVAGIDVRLHWTGLVAAAFIAAALAGGVFPSEVRACPTAPTS